MHFYVNVCLKLFSCGHNSIAFRRVADMHYLLPIFTLCLYQKYAYLGIFTILAFVIIFFRSLVFTSHYSHAQHD